MNYKYHKSYSKKMFNIMKTVWLIHSVICTSIKKILTVYNILLNSIVTRISILPLFRSID